MKNSLSLFALSGALLVMLAFTGLAATPAQEKAFTDKYKTALEGKDTATSKVSFTRRAPTPRRLSSTK